MKCFTCNGSCVERMSNKDNANKGKFFFSCSSASCGKFVGWSDNMGGIEKQTKKAKTGEKGMLVLLIMWGGCCTHEIGHMLYPLGGDMGDRIFAYFVIALRSYVRTYALSPTPPLDHAPFITGINNNNNNNNNNSDSKSSKEEKDAEARGCELQVSLEEL